MTNFTFIKDVLPEVYELGFKTEEHLKQALIILNSQFLILNGGVSDA
ncbi:hypothetical protein PQO03_06735 [Lentisphaera profundi]|uniref:Uncharacterized protein n=1 Tax=Lentisphaera profundi TaxID=1658616 RepID=A0ABY7VR97_9BACT|nr:hypothetical protein [Lentisphaera profundi]WDE95412.1 hypothetical protein PQO03_06735 [Lentisphaera profundi]